MMLRVPRRRFSPAEDKSLNDLIARYGDRDWNLIASFMPGRSARQCRHRVDNYLLGNHRETDWSDQEEALVITKFREIGPRWVLIAESLDGRTANDVKNRWYKHISRRLQAEAFSLLPKLPPCPELPVIDQSKNRIPERPGVGQYIPFLEYALNSPGGVQFPV
jgi:hypothetical protein